MEKKTTKCGECYSEHPRVTPLLGARECLERHRQYICGTCGRIVCIDLGGERRARCFMPFKTREIALLYVKCAEIISGKACGIYKLTYKRGDERYRIFESGEILDAFLKKNREVTCENKKPVYKTGLYTPVREDQVRYLSPREVDIYLRERNQLGIREK